MQFTPFAVLMAAAARLSMAATPSGFNPASNVPLEVYFDKVDATNDPVIPQSACGNAPQLATRTKMAGTSFAILMVDLDIPTNTPPKTTTLLHWMQLNLTQSTKPSLLSTNSGAPSAFKLQIPAVAPVAPYLSPSPPARIPLSHRYTQLLIDISSASQANLGVLTAAAKTRGGFDADAILTRAGLVDKVVAGNFFNVTNPGPATNAAL